MPECPEVAGARGQTTLASVTRFGPSNHPLLMPTGEVVEVQSVERLRVKRETWCIRVEGKGNCHRIEAIHIT
jgi:hypothetical protein